MIESIEKVIAVVTRDPLTALEVARALGQIEQDLAGSITVKPSSDPAFTEAKVVRQFGTEAFASVELTLAKPLSLDALSQKFGEYHRIPAVDKLPEQVVFYVDPPGKPCTAAVIAALDGTQSRSVVIRRDIR
jgi:uncharacterized protein YqfB (UPF0267 family)